MLKIVRNGKILGKFNIIDFVIISIIALLIIGVLAVKGGIFNPLSKKSFGVKPVEFTVITRAYDVINSETLFKEGDKTFITIRNVPYTELEIVKAEAELLREMYIDYDRPEVPYVLKNIAYPNRVQFVVTLKDNAHITKDGAVIGGNKIKIGLPVDLEGPKYRLSGMVSDVKIIEEESK